jgi:hypothetical protein
MIDKDDEPTLHMHECTTYETNRKIIVVVSCVSVLAAAGATYRNAYVDDRRQRYPGRLVTCFGLSILLLNLTVALGWLIDFKQLDWGEESNYHYFYPYDDEGDSIYYNICTAQGAVVEFSLICTVVYACWICVAFYNAVRTRFSLARLTMGYEQKSSVMHEVGAHASIVFGALAVSAYAAWSGTIGSNSGIIACWVEGYEYQQVYYFYLPMTVVIGFGMALSFTATLKLWRVLKSAGRNDMWAENHRPLRRVIYGNIAWALSTIICGTIPAVDIWEDTNLTCLMANISTSMTGVLFLVDYTIVPYYLERCFEREWQLSIAGPQGGGYARFGEDEYFPPPGDLRESSMTSSGASRARTCDLHESSINSSGASRACSAPELEIETDKAVIHEGEEAQVKSQLF